jgi:hypothetical protein
MEPPRIMQCAARRTPAMAASRSTSKVVLCVESEGSASRKSWGWVLRGRGQVSRRIEHGTQGVGSAGGGGSSGCAGGGGNGASSGHRWRGCSGVVGVTSPGLGTETCFLPKVQRTQGNSGSGPPRPGLARPLRVLRNAAHAPRALLSRP